MTKKQVFQAERAAYRKACDEGRVLRFFDGKYFKSYATIEARDAALAEAKIAGVPCNVVAS